MKSHLLLVCMITVSCIKLEAQTSCNPLITSGLVAYYPFCGNANDASGSGNNGTATGVTLTADRFGNANSAYSFNGTASDYITCPAGSATSLNVTGDYSLCFWFKTSQGVNDIISFGDGINANGGGYISGLGQGGAPAGKLGYSIQGIWHNSTGTLNNNSWHFASITFNSGTLKLYIDNVLDVTSTSVLPPLSWNGTRIIGKRNDSNPAPGPFQGVLDDISVFNRALTQTEVTQIFNNTLITQTCLPLITSGLAAYYPFCGNANDASGSGNNGTATGVTLAADRLGNANSAYSFNGTAGNYITCPSGSATSLNLTGDYSLCFWFKSSQGVNDIIFFGDGINANGGGYIAGLGQGSAPSGKLGYANQGIWHNSTNTLNDNSWHFASITFNAGTLKLYIDNALDVTSTGVLPPLSWNGTRIIGKRNDSNPAPGPYQGILDDISIYSRALLPCEIQTLYNGNPAFVASITGTTTVCSGSPTTLTASGGSTYVWNTNATTTSIVVSPTTASVYTVTATNVGGCTAIATTSVAVNALPAVPTVSVSMTTLTSSAATGNQWYLNGSPIGGATAQSYSVTQNGTYLVCVTDANSCSNCSTPLNFTTTGVIENADDVSVSVFPNPASAMLNINFTTTMDQRITVDVINTLGQTIRSIDFGIIPSGKNTNTVSVAGVPAGVYCLKISGCGFQHNIPVIVEK